MGEKVCTRMNIEDTVDLNDVKRIFKIVNKKNDFGDNPMFSKAVLNCTGKPMTMMIKHRLNADFSFVSLIKKEIQKQPKL